MSITKDSIKGVARAVLSDIRNTNDQARADWVFTGRYISKHFSSAEIGTNVNMVESPFFTTKFAGSVLRFRCIPAQNVAINASNYVYVQLSKSTAGAASVLVASLNTAVTAVTKFVPTVLALNTNAVSMLADDVLTLTVTKTISTGTASVDLAGAGAFCEFILEVDEGY